MCLGIYQFPPGLLGYVHRIVLVMSGVVCISVESVVISPLLFLFHLFDYFLFSFLLIWLVIYFLDLFKKPAPGFIDFF